MARRRITVAIVFTLVARVAAAPGDPPPYCAVDSPGSRVAVVRPAAGEAPLDDVNWFARPVPNSTRPPSWPPIGTRR